MIEGKVAESAAGFFARLTARAGRLAEARALARTLEPRDPSQRWRQAGLLWPLFAKD